MNKFWKEAFLVIGVLAISLFFLLSYKHFVSSPYLEFSDAAKVGDVARNLYQTGQLKKSFAFFDVNPDFSIKGIPVINPIVTYLSFKILEISDFAVVAPSMLFFLLSSITIYFLGKKISGNLVGVLSTVVFASNPDMLVYAVNGASESLFIFEILLVTLLITYKKLSTDLLSLLILLLLYFTRPQAFIFIAGLVFYWLILKFGIKKAILSIIFLGSIFLIFDRLVLYPLSFKTNLYSITSRGEQAILYYPAGGATSNGLRGADIQKLTYSEVGKKVFYNSYNLYKLIPQIMSPYLFALFVIGLLFWKKNVSHNYLKLIVLLLFISSVLVASLTIPLIRYIHPVVPLVYLFAVDTLISILKQFLKNKQDLGFMIYDLRIDSKYFINLKSLFIILLFVVVPTLGIIFLDSRNEDKNIEPPIYRDFALFLKDNTQKNDVILTNLDTWGSWYGERKTIWYPVTVDLALKSQDNFDAIYLTSYKVDDANYQMGEDWKDIFENPQILKGYKFSAEYKKNGDRAILLTKIK